MTTDVATGSRFVALPASRIFAEQTTALGIESPGTGNPTLTTGDAPDSICPYAWRLPKNENDGSFNDLIRLYSMRSGNSNPTNADTIVQIAPLTFRRIGSYSSGTLGSQNSYIYYWSSKRGGSTGTAYGTLFRSNAFYLQHTYDRGMGMSLRCLAR